MQVIIVRGAGQRRRALGTADLLLSAVGHLARFRETGEWRERAGRQPYCAAFSWPLTARDGRIQTVLQEVSLAPTTVRE